MDIVFFKYISLILFKSRENYFCSLRALHFELKLISYKYVIFPWLHTAQTPYQDFFRKVWIFPDHSVIVLTKKSHKSRNDITLFFKYIACYLIDRHCVLFYQTVVDKSTVSWYLNRDLLLTHHISKGNCYHFSYI